MTNVDARLQDKTLTAIGRSCARFLWSEEPWSDRCVETVFITSETMAVRQVTVDVTLPEKEVVLDGEELPLHYVPLATLHKDPPTSRIDLVDEHGTTVPLLNRSQHSAITAIAAHQALEHLVGRSLSQELKSDLLELCSKFGPAGLAARAVVLARLSGVECPQEMEASLGLQIATLLRELLESSILWIPAAGQPGRRRSFKLRYELPLSYSPLIRKPPGDVELDVEIVPLDDHPDAILRTTVRFESDGDGLESSTFHRVLSRITTPLSLSAVEVVLPYPHLGHSRSYHLQVVAPAGLEVRNLAVRTKDADFSQHDPPPDRGHIHVGRLSKPGGPATVRFRVGRRGLLTQALVACTLITTLLWGFSLHSKTAENRADVAAPVLLLAPALLAAIAVRPGEHQIASRILGGVRGAVAISGASGIVASAGFAGVRFHWATIHAELHTLAIVSTASTGLLLTGWILALRTSERVRGFLRRRWIGREVRYLIETALVLVICTVGLALIPVPPHPNGLEHGITGSFLALAALASLWVAAFARDCGGVATRSTEMGGLAQAILLAFAAMLAYGLKPFGWDLGSARGLLVELAAVPWAILLALALISSLQTPSLAA